ncbi:MAG TPA: hypothetical protein VL400_14990 [Polyangiaceae bacterium]|nr:hypothetical protein [Polyangiaceae bacterium]
MSAAVAWAAVAGSALAVTFGGAGEARAEEARLAVVLATGEEVGATGLVGISHAAPAKGDVPESVRVVAIGSAALPKTVSLTTLPAPDSEGRRSVLDALSGLALSPSACPAWVDAGKLCASTATIQLVPDELDRRHPLLDGRALVGEAGGTMVASADGAAETTVKVGVTAGRFRARLRVHLVRMIPAGPAPIGRDDADAARLVRDEVARASRLWGVCGISLGPSAETVIEVVDPPPPSLVAVGCEGGTLAARGGAVRLRVDGQEVAVDVARGTSPRGAARVVAAAIEKKGFQASVSDNAVVHAATFATSDILVRRRNGQLATVSAPKSGPVSTDAALDVCIGRVSLEDGLSHFSDADAISGTLEERSMIKALEDGDPSTLDVFVVPSFGGDARIGESFIFADESAIKDVVIEDRAGFRAHRASFTLAHEIGHVLLDQPGHPDDFGSDTPTSLMDADAMSPTAFGPRRLSVDECARAVRESGPGSGSDLLVRVPPNAANVSRAGAQSATGR